MARQHIELLHLLSVFRIKGLLASCSICKVHPIQATVRHEGYRVKPGLAAKPLMHTRIVASFKSQTQPLLTSLSAMKDVVWNTFTFSRWS